MVVQVFLLGDKLLDRLRNATLAILGAVTAIGLILVALVLQQGWPSVIGGPLPGFPHEPSDEIASAVPKSPGGGAATTPRSGVVGVPPRAGSVSGGSGFDDSRNQGSRQVAASAPVTSSPDPGPSDTAPESPAAPPVVGTSPSPAAPTVVAPPPAQASPAASAKGGDGNGDKTAAGAESKKTRGKGKVAANGKGPSSKGATTAATAKPKSSSPKKSSGAKPTSPPADKANVEPVPAKPAPPVYEPSKNEAETLPVEEKGEPGSQHGYVKDK